MYISYVHLLYLSKEYEILFYFLFAIIVTKESDKLDHCVCRGLGD